MIRIAESPSITVYSRDDLSEPTSDINADVEVVDEAGRRWSGTFFTRDDVEALFAENRETGECGGGLYLWAAEGEFEGAFGLLDEPA